MQWELHENVWRRNYGNLRKMTYYKILSFLKSVENSYFFFVKSLPRNNGTIVDKVREMSDRMSIYILL